MKDFLGNKLNAGDKVVFISKHYREFATGTIKKLGVARVTIELRTGGTTTRAYDVIIKI